MRFPLLAVAVLCLGGMLLSSPSANADTGQDPPVVAIYEIVDGTTTVDVEAVTVEVDEILSLLGVATGNAPLYFYWFLDAGSGGALCGVGQLLDLSFPDPGLHLLTLEVVDGNGLSGYDSLVITVPEDSVPQPATSWSALKARW